MSCAREDELLDALGRGYIGAELEAHVAGCEACSELRIVAGALLDDRRDAVLSAPVPSAGTMLLRMRLRHRQEAAAAARRSLLIGQAATLLIGIALVVSFFGTDLAADVKTYLAAVRVGTPLMYVIATWLLVAPIAGWAAVRK